MSARASAPDTDTTHIVARADALEQLERILAHRLFRHSHRLSAFLRFAVEAALAGETGRLKETAIGADVFERGAAFDPQTDNVVRVSANRLRSKLAEYYLRDGRADPIVIDLPRGRYVPLFSLLPSSDRSASAPVHGSKPLPTSVGRQPELDRLHSALTSASASRGLMLTISGDAGMGKTTLVEDFLAEIDTSPAPVWIARGRCSERLGKTDAFVPVFECLDDLLHGDMGDRASALMAEVAPAWLAQLAPGRDPSSGAPAQEASPERMQREFVRFFEELSSIHPVVLFFDDLHWADASTCELLSRLGARIRDIPILIVTTARAADQYETSPCVPLQLALERRGACQTIQLELLTLPDIECYLSRRFPSNRFSMEFAAVVHERTEGSPLFMRDMIEFLVDTRILTERQNVWHIDGDVATVRKIIPAGTQSMIRLQIRQFSEMDRRILQCAAVQGVVFDSTVVSRVLSIDPADVEDHLQALERVHRFVTAIGEREFRDRSISIRYRFVHVFYQNALYADLAPSRGADTSVAVAESLIDLTGGADRTIASEIALLFETGRDNDRAAQYFLSAARHASRVFAYPEAVLLCERGLASLDFLAQSRDRDSRELELSLTLGLAQMATRGYAAPEVERTHRRARELCIRLNEKRRLIQVLWGIHTCLMNAGELSPALKVAEEMRQAADSFGFPATIIESLHALGTTLAFMGELADAREALEWIFKISPVGEHRYCGSLYIVDPCVTSLSMLARVLARMGHLDDAIEKATTSVDLATGLSHPPSVAYSRFWVGWIRHARGEHAEACRELDTAMALSLSHGLPQILEWARVVRGSSLAHIGRIAEGIGEIRTSLDNQSAMRCFLERPYCLTLLAEALMLANERPEALTLCDEALTIGRETQGRSYEAETLRLRESILRAGHFPAS